MQQRNYAEIAKQYARDVGSGRQPAGKSIRLQCGRYLDELKRSRRKDFPFRFDEKKAGRICRFIECLPHTKGAWARKKQLLVLEPWQIWLLCYAFGWLHKAGPRKGLRRFRRLVPIIPRKNGKSALAAGIALYMFCLDGEAGAEVYSGAANEAQAWEVFGPARLMAMRSPMLTSGLNIEVNAKSLVRHDDGSKFETITGDPGDGQSPSCAIHDEYHEHRDDRQVDTMISGMGSREQPMQVLITTAGDNLDGPCYALVHEEREKLQGIGHASGSTASGLGRGPPLDDETLFIEYAADEDDDWRDGDVLRKANPNYGVSVSAEYLLARQRDAIRTPRKSALFKTKHLNLWVAAKTAWYDIEKWRQCADDALPQHADAVFDLEALRGRRCIAGLDLASKRDIAALELLFTPLGVKATVDDPYIRAGWYFLPEDRVQDVPSYLAWDANDLLSVTPGNITDYDEIFEKLRRIRDTFQLEQIAYDPHQATYLVTSMQKEGMPCIEYRPVVLNFSEPMKELDALMQAGTIAHGNCPVMEWQISNVTGQLDKKDNVYPNKPRVEAKIDNPVALLSALGVAMAGDEEQGPSVYEERGVLVI